MPSLRLSVHQERNATAGAFVLEGYLVGRFLTAILEAIPGAEVTRQAILDTVYNTRAFVLADMTLGIFGRIYPGCEELVCGCNQGLHKVFSPVPVLT